MPMASYAVSSFLGGEISQFAQGRFDKPDYRISLNVCLNAFPTEIGGWTPRPGTHYAGHARGGAAGRVLPFDFEQAVPYTMEFSAGFLRFRNGTAIISTNDSQIVLAVSTANPAVVQTTTAHGYSTGNTVYFSSPGPLPILENRQFTITFVDSTHFSLQDALTGANINGAAFGAIVSNTSVFRIQELTTVYSGTTWGPIRSVQAETTAILLHNAYQPQAVTVTTLPTPNTNAIFAIASATFTDGPYLDPFTNGVQVTPSALTGVVQLTLNFQVWAAGVSYANGVFVTSDSINYESLIDQNISNAISVTFTGGGSPVISATNTFSAGNRVAFFSAGGTLPAALTQGKAYFVIATGLSGSQFEVSATSGGSAINMATAGTGTQTVALAPINFPSNWLAVSAGAAINPPPGQPNGLGRGFLSTDIGRLVRLYSEPALWNANASYVATNVVAYNPSGLPGAATYWQSLTSNTNKVPGTDVTNWELVAPGATLPAVGNLTSPTAGAGPAQWTWGKITSLLNTVPSAPSGVAYIGNMTLDGGLSAAFNGQTSQVLASSAVINAVIQPTQSVITGSGFVGENFGGASPSSYAVQSATVFGASDDGLASINVTGFVANAAMTGNVQVALYGSNSAPANGTNGTLLGVTTVGVNIKVASISLINLLPTAVTVTSNNTATTYQYLWVTISVNVLTTGLNSSLLNISAAQVQFTQGAGTGASANGCNVEILGPALLYTQPILTWRLGAYSNTTGWPTCGCYADGRAWFGGAINNRFDASVANGIVGSVINMAPTDQYGVVSAASAIAETLNSNGINPIFWMEPDQQGILIGTQSTPWLIFAPTGGAISPLNIAARKLVGPGAANVLIRRTEHTYVYVQRYQIKLMELFPDIFSGKFTAPNLADKAQHITRAGIAELAYVQSAAPVIWGRDNAGALFGLTYKRDTLTTSQGPTYYAWHRHALGSGRFVQSICSGPSVGGNLDALTMMTLDATSGIYHCEVMGDQADELTALANAWYLDDAVNPTSTSTTNAASTYQPYGGLTINGLWHLNGKVVQVFAGGLDCGAQDTTAYPAWVSGTSYPIGAVVSFGGINYFSLTASNSGNMPSTSPSNWQAGPYIDFMVSNGSITVPYGDGISAGPGNGLFTAAFAAGLANTQIVIGFTYNKDGQLVRPVAPAETGTRNGPALGKARRNHRYAMLLSNTLGLQVGTNFTKMLPERFTQPDYMTALPALTTFSGVQYGEIKDDYSRDGMICWRVARPFPANIAALEANIETQDW